MTVETIEQLPLMGSVLEDVLPLEDNNTTTEHDNDEDDEGDEPRKKTRRSRRGGYRRKRQQQKKVAALMAEAAAKRAAAKSGEACDSTDTATTEEEESSSCESSSGGSFKSPPRNIARKRNTAAIAMSAQQQQQQQRLIFEQQQQMYQHHQAAYYQAPPMHTAHPQLYPAYNNNYNAYNYGVAHKPNYGPKSKYGIPPPPPRAHKSRSSKPQKRGGLTRDQHDGYVALDCEMVGTGVNGEHSILARVTMVDWYGNTIYDQLVQPQYAVTDYRTFVSGITKEMLDTATMDYATVRTMVLSLLKGKILVGHGLANDMRVLGISHPNYMTRDTAKYEPFMKIRFDDGLLWPRGLKDLCREKLGRDVQVYGRPHCPKEDALAALDLYRLVSSQWEQAMDYRMSKTWALQPQHTASGCAVYMRKAKA